MNVKTERRKIERTIQKINERRKECVSEERNERNGEEETKERKKGGRK